MKKFFFSYIFIIIFLSVLILLGSIKTIKKFYIKNSIQNLKKIGYSLDNSIVPILEQEKIKILISNLSKKLETRITIIDLNGKVIIDSEKDSSSMDNHKTRIEIIEACNNKIGSIIRYSSTLQCYMLYVAMPIKKQGQIVSILRLSVPIKDINIFLFNLNQKIFYFSLLAMLIAICLGYFYSKKFSKPIIAISNAAKKVADGEFGPALCFDCKDELKDLCSSFNIMTLKLKTLFTELSTKKQEIERIISSINESFFVIDNENKIKLSNKSFRKFFNISQEQNRPYWELIKNIEFCKLIETIKKKNKNTTQEITIFDKNFICSNTFLPEPKENIIILHDINELKKLEKMKKDFDLN